MDIRYGRESDLHEWYYAANIKRIEFGASDGTWHPTEAAAREHEESAGAERLAQEFREVLCEPHVIPVWPTLLVLARRAIALGADPKKIGDE